MIASPLELWRALQADAGLELRMKKGTPGRDVDLEEALLVSLSDPTVAPTVATVEALLIADAASPSPSVTVESLLEAILAVQEGFAAMMNDILETLLLADATNASEALSIEFSFNKVSAPLKLTLLAFREQVERIKAVLNNRLDVPDSDTRWDLLKILRALAGITSSVRSPFPLLSEPPAPPSSDNQAVDHVLVGLVQLVSDFCSWCMTYGTDRKRVFHIVCNRFPNFDSDPVHEAARRHAADATDGWDINTIDAVKKIARAVQIGDVDAALITNTIEPWLLRLPSRQAQLKQRYNQLIDILKLPAWQKRHELYSVWVGTALLRSAKTRATRLEFHPVNGVLSFAFGGSRLATYDWDGAQFDVWAEFRSDLTVKSDKRKKGIQPDFRVMRATLRGSDNAKTRFVLECKHYLKPSLSNFTQAAKDYARSCHNADVFIVNHGPADHDFLSAHLPPDVTGRVQFLGGIMAGKTAEKLEDAIANILFPSSALVPVVASPARNITDAGGSLTSVAGSIRLAWDETLGDLDLSLTAIDAEGNLRAQINYEALGNLHAEPYARLDRDVREGPGAEQIDVERWHYARYDVIVTQYSGAGQMRHGHLRCTIVLGTEYKIIEFPLARDPHYPWRVARIEVIDGVPNLRLLDRERRA